MIKLSFKPNKLSLNNFDFILNSIENVYANSELTKCLFDNNDPRRCIAKFSTCSLEIIEELIYSRNKQDDPHVRFFLNSVRSFHNIHKCSTKTLICFTLFLWRQIKFIFMQQNDHYAGLSPRLFSKYLSLVLEEIIQKFVNNNTELVQSLHANNRKTYFRENYKFYQNLISGVCRNQSIYSEIIYEIVDEFTKTNQDVSTFSSEIILILVSSPTQNFKNVSERLDSSMKSSNIEFQFTIERGIYFSLEDLNFGHFKNLKDLNK
jgi:hypothetical protein